jgi:hypothetical protein
MSLDQFMLWRFRMLEGVLDGIKSWNLNECVFNDGSKITYDLKNELITINTPKKIETMLFANVTKEKLSEFGFRERTDNRHNCSYDEGTYNFQYR